MIEPMVVSKIAYQVAYLFIYIYSIICQNICMSIDSDPTKRLHTELTFEEQQAFHELTQNLASELGSRALSDRDSAWHVSPRPNPLDSVTSSKIPPGHIAYHGDFDSQQ